VRRSWSVQSLPGWRTVTVTLADTFASADRLGMPRTMSACLSGPGTVPLTRSATTGGSRVSLSRLTLTGVVRVMLFCLKAFVTGPGHRPCGQGCPRRLWFRRHSGPAFTKCRGSTLANSVPSASASLPLETGTPRSESTAVLDDREARSAFGDSCFEPDGARRAEEDAECSRPAAV
jgi:hypothetical protein